MLIAIDCVASLRAVDGIYAGRGSRLLRERVLRSAARLGLPQPPEREPSKLRSSSTTERTR